MKKHKESTNFKSTMMEFLQKFGRGLMLPISILPFAGLLLGIGGAIGSNVHSLAGEISAGVFNGMSSIIFSNLPILFCVAVLITFTGESGSAALMGIIGYLVFTSSQTVFIHSAPNGGFLNILWFHNQPGLASLVGQNLGIKSLQTSLFGGILIGFLVAWIYNKFKYIQLPNLISFFSGIRFLPFLIIPLAFATALGFLIFWPWIGLGIYWLGAKAMLAPVGVDGFIYGIITRALMPFGLHQIVVAVAYQTPFGGSLKLEQLLNLKNVAPMVHLTLLEAFLNFSKGAIIIEGDQNLWNFINSIPLNQINGIPIFEWFHQNFNIYAGRFTQDYPTYLGLCVGIGAALILAADKDKRKITASVIGSAVFVAFLTGITEPLEFTFLFVAPVLYYAVYVPLSGVSYMLMQLVGAHVGVGFARGFIDLMVYGALPVMKGTRFYWAFLFAPLEGGLIFLIFYSVIKKKNLATPGRNGNDVVLMTKKTYKQTVNKTEPTGLEPRTIEVLTALGGYENLKSVTSCATRLRVVLLDGTLVDKEKLKQLGASGVIVKQNNVQVIFGGEAIVLAEKINNNWNSN
ncbi:glucose-specific PTS system IIABC component [Spiroplasma clarkii]|uniref:PTS system, glucose-specific IIABC component n=1 Tax=Spiroplasma clarkii TaxID=2139 RepID=A0A1Y0L1P6_9MOLU|nr:PTS transporter subunit EIIC [Spiroplasma clarkii]ARU91906.1 glucose-specific PTS system IIABC component [Spiroplasma clarkii]ATX71252.1 PTS system, glucose-specific IIABC component [Spiroplasma clarkii]